MGGVRGRSGADADEVARPLVTQTNFTTLDTSPALRASLWEDYYRRARPMLRAWPVDSHDLRFSVRRTRLPQLEILEMAGDSTLVGRTRDLIESAPRDFVNLSILTRGDAFLQSGGRTEVLAPGDAVLWDPRSPAVYGRGDDFAEVSLSIPRRLFLARRSLDADEPRVIRLSETEAREQVGSRLALLSVTLETQPVDADVVYRVADELFDLVLGGPGAASWRAARDHIRRMLHDPLLTVSAIADAAGLSERQLARIFAGHGTTVWQTVVSERLTAAYRLLLDPAHPTLSIARVAELCGFASSSQFATAFRRVHGVSPTQLRKSMIDL